MGTVVERDPAYLTTGGMELHVYQPSVSCGHKVGVEYLWNLKQNWAEPWSSDCQVENPGAFIPRTMQSKQQQTQQTLVHPAVFEAYSLPRCLLQ